MKRVVVIGDTHCGHLAGLTHEGYFLPPDTHVGKLQREMLKRYMGWVEKYHKPDVLLCMGDMIDGKGHRSGGTEQSTTDRKKQVDIAEELIQRWDAERIFMVYGTPYHVGNDEDWERVLADRLDAEIHGQMFVEVEGVTFHMKHKVGASSIPHGRHTAVARERMWLQLWEDAAEWPRAQVVLRGHVHYHDDCGNHTWRAMTCPCLQAPSTKYGSRQCSGTVDFGIVVFEVEDGRWDWKAEIVTMAEAKPAVVRA